jgi:hypothetical protein
MIGKLFVLPVPKDVLADTRVLLSPKGQPCYRLRVADRQGNTLLQQGHRGALVFSIELLEALGLHLLIEGEELTDGG